MVENQYDNKEATDTITSGGIYSAYIYDIIGDISIRYRVNHVCKERQSYIY